MIETTDSDCQACPDYKTSSVSWALTRHVDKFEARLPRQGEWAGKVGGDHGPHHGSELLTGHQRAGAAQPGPVAFGGGVITRNSANFRAQPHVGIGIGQRFGRGTDHGGGF